MLNLFFLPSVFNGFSPELLNILIVISLLAGVFIIISKKFIGLSYLLVYVGAVSILFLFILMLINIRVSELISDTNNNIPLAILTILGFFIPYNKILPDTKIAYNLDILNKDRSISIVSSNNWDSNLIDTYDIINIGNVMYTNLSMWLIITSIILLLAMVGSIVITVKQKY